MLQIYNSKSQKKEFFKPIKDKEIGLYVCGVTVYDYSHVGHARVYLTFDTIKRYLMSKGYKIKHIQNITDIDDKIIKRANERNISCEELTNEYIKAFREDMKALNVMSPESEPRATEFVSEMIDLISKLIDKGFAYVGKDGDVFYDVQKFPHYGCLSHRNLDDLMAGARIDVNEAKNHPLDFVLWKMAKPNEPSWESPWGKGRPGWHTECVVMSTKELGETFDIHGGGPDLKFPHHENELAQAEAVTGKRFVNCWMHVGYLQINQEKMAKSLGNFVTIRDFLKVHEPEVLRYFSIGSHYRSPVEFSEENVQIAKQALERLYMSLRGLDLSSSSASSQLDVFATRFDEAMEDDFNTPAALAVLFDLAREINKVRETNPQEAAVLGSRLKHLGNLLGLLYKDPELFLQGNNKDSEKVSEIEELIKRRDSARQNKDWAESDRIRKLLLEQGIILEDKKGKTEWRKIKA